MKNSAALGQFKIWELDLAVADLLAPTCFSIFTQMANFRCNNSFLQSAIKLLDDGKFIFNEYSLYLGLEDIYNITGLPVDGVPIVCDDFDPTQLIMDVLGDDDPSRIENRFYVKKAWLKSRFEKVPDDILRANDEGLLRHARAYLLFLMGTILFSENQKSTVFVGYLMFLRDLTAQAVNSFAWGTAVLAKLQAGFENLTCSKGAIWILEMFFLERIPSLQKEYLGILDPKRNTSLEFPSCLYWSRTLKDVSTNMHSVIRWDDLLAGVQRKKDIYWRPYRRFKKEKQRIFYSCFVLFDIDIINFHRPQLSPRQLNINEVDESAIKMVKYTSKSRKGHANWNLLQKYKKVIKFWNDSRYNSVVKGKEEGFVLPPIPQPRRETGSCNDNDQDRERREGDTDGCIDNDNDDGYNDKDNEYFSPHGEERNDGQHEEEGQLSPHEEQREEEHDRQKWRRREITPHDTYLDRKDRTSRKQRTM